MSGGIPPYHSSKKKDSSACVYRVEIVPLFVTVPELIDVWVALTFVELLSPTTVVLTMLCEPIAVIDVLAPLPASRPSRAALTCAAELPSRLCMVLESCALLVEPAAPHIRPEVPVELVVPLTGVLCACAEVDTLKEIDRMRMAVAKPRVVDACNAEAGNVIA